VVQDHPYYSGRYVPRTAVQLLQVFRLSYGSFRPKADIKNYYIFTIIQ
jgi:hypothetical protein